MIYFTDIDSSPIGVKAGGPCSNYGSGTKPGGPCTNYESPTWVIGANCLSHHYCFPGSSIPGGWNWNLQLTIKYRCSNMGGRPTNVHLNHEVDHVLSDETCSMHKYPWFGIFAPAELLVEVDRVILVFGGGSGWKAGPSQNSWEMHLMKPLCTESEIYFVPK